jgi:hypothetical protein
MSNTPTLWRRALGELLKFNKGDYLAGQEDTPVPEGTVVVPVMDELTVGWIKWEDSKPVEHMMGRVADGYRPPRRSELGDTDQSRWPADGNGKPHDPWQISNYLPMKLQGTSKLYTFTASSRGSLNAVADLCRTYARRKKPDTYPAVVLKVGAYQHAQYGRIKFPSFIVEGWVPKFSLDGTAPVADTSTKAMLDDEIPW